MDSEKRKLPPNPRETTNPLSILTFFWTLPIFVKGYKRPLELEDMYEALKKDKSETIGDTLERHFLKDEALCKAKRKELGITDPEKGPQPSLGKALFKTFWVELCFLGVIITFNEVFVRLANPILLGKLLEYFRPESTMAREDALWYAGGMVLLSGLNALCMNHYMLGAFHMGMRARVAVCSLIYRKSLRLSRNALGESAPGKVVNLLSNDVNRFDIAAMFLHFLWLAPLVSLVTLYFLWVEVGVSGLLGVMVVFTVMPIQAYTGKLSARFRLQTALKTDERVRFMGEIISGVQVIKMYAWEKPFQALITLARKLEIKVIRKNSYVRAVFMTFLLTTTRIAVFFVMFSMILFGYKLTSAKIFVISTYFNLLASTISTMFVRAIAEVAEAYVALQRLQKYLRHEEFVETRSYIAENEAKPKSKTNGLSDTLSSENGDSPAPEPYNHDVLIKVVGAEARWLPDKPLTLDLDRLEIPRGKLIGVIGPVGCGKSSLLQAFLGELPLLKGSLEVRGNVSYACQEPWVFGASVRQNILFGKPYDKFRYNEVIRVCALQRDFEQFPFGDQTLVGERGTSLSGGQKARINLARAVYRDADIYLLDDPLSAVDAHVGRHLFEQCVVAHLRHRTRVLVTHQLHYLKDAHHIILLKDGRIEMQGTYHEMSTSSLQYAQLLIPSTTVAEVESSEDKGRERLQSRSKPKLKRYDSISSQRKRSDSITSSILDLDLSAPPESDSEDEAPQHKEQQAVAEASSAGVGGQVGLKYLMAGGSVLSLLFVMSSFLVSQIFVSAADYWMSYWTSQEELRNYYNDLNNTDAALLSALTANETDTADTSPLALLSSTVTSLIVDNVTFGSNSSLEGDSSWTLNLPPLESLYSSNDCIMIHGIIVGLALVLTLLRSFSFYNLAMRSSMALHNMMFRGVIRSPMLFFNLNPSGRIMNRFAKDMGSIDELLPKAILDATQVLLQMFGSIILACYVNPYFLVPILVLSVLFLIIRKIYLQTSKNIKRMEGVAKSPVFTHLSATIQGLSTIRAFGEQKMVKGEFDNFQNLHTSAWYMFISTSSAFGQLLDFLCLLLIALVIFSFLLLSTSLLGDKVGLAITQCMSLTFMVQWGIRQSAEVINQLMAVERVLEYTLLPPEEGIAPDEIDRKSKSIASQKVMATKLRDPPREWPEYGRVVFKELSMKYTEKEEDTFVLRDLNCDFQPKEKIGIVGRTGAGKSSLISALFRLAFNTGAVIIDGVDTRDISLTDLRKKISIIPQDPVLFSGTLRRNLDPFEEYSDTAVWQALEEVELKEALSGPAGLESNVMDGGSNFSVGQRQLVCLARALLRKNRLLMLDEATANVDPRTDSLIQTTIRDKFAHCTVLTVAHRLNTIMDSDRVLVMDRGTVVELLHPHLLLQNKDGFFSKMVAETGKQNAAELARIAKENYLSKHGVDDIKMIDE